MSIETYKEFMKEVESSLGLFSLEDSSPLLYLAPTKDGEESHPLVSKGGYTFLKALVSNSKHFVELEGTKVVLKHLPFMPIQEDTIKSETESFLAMKSRMLYILKLSIYELGILMLNLVRNDKGSKNLGVGLEKFLLECNKGDTRGVKNLVDDNTFTQWHNICTRNKKVDDFKELIEISSVRNKKINGETYKRLSSAYFPLFETLDSADRSKDNKINGVTLRNKDLAVFHAIFKSITSEVTLDSYVFKIGSNKDKYPAFVSLYCLYLKIMGTIVELASKLKQYGDENSLVFNISLDVKPEQVGDKVDSIEKQINMIPTERSLLQGDTSAQQVTEKQETKIMSYDNSVAQSFMQQPEQVQHVIQQPVPQQQYVQQAMPQQPMQQMASNPSDKAAAMFSRPNVAYPVMPGNLPGSRLNMAIDAVASGGAILGMQPQMQYPQMNQYGMQMPQQMPMNQNMMYNQNAAYPMAAPVTNLPPLNSQYPYGGMPQQMPMNMGMQQQMMMQQPQRKPTSAGSGFNLYS